MTAWTATFASITAACFLPLAIAWMATSAPPLSVFARFGHTCTNIAIWVGTPAAVATVISFIWSFVR